jgi:Flp pilus assembly protein TadD
LARLQAQQGQTAAALATIDSHRLADATAQGLRGGLLAQTGDYPRALAAYESAARQEPANPLWWFGLGVALESEGDPARARQAYTRAQASGLAPEELAHYAEQRLRALD